MFLQPVQLIPVSWKNIYYIETATSRLIYSAWTGLILLVILHAAFIIDTLSRNPRVVTRRGQENVYARCKLHDAYVAT